VYVAVGKQRSTLAQLVKVLEREITCDDLE
jgi:F0F1-type ATP synthase alpha subunit